MMIITNLQTVTNSSRQDLAKVCTNVLNSYLYKAYTVILLLPMDKKSLYKELLHNGNQRICISHLVANQSILRSVLACQAREKRAGKLCEPTSCSSVSQKVTYWFTFQFRLVICWVNLREYVELVMKLRKANPTHTLHSRIYQHFSIVCIYSNLPWQGYDLSILLS